MSAVCDICAKKPQFGRQYARAGKGALKRYVKNKSSRVFRPNIQRIRIHDGGTSKRINVCTSCLKAGKVVR